MICALSMYEERVACVATRSFLHGYREMIIAITEEFTTFML